MPDTTIETQVSTVKSKAEPEAKKTRLVADTKRAYDAITMAAWATAGRDDVSVHIKHTDNPLCSRAPFTGPRFGKRAELSTSDNDAMQSVLAALNPNADYPGESVLEILGERWWHAFLACDGSIGSKPRRRDPDLYPRLQLIAEKFEWTYGVPTDEGKKTETVKCRVAPSTVDAVKATGMNPSEFFRQSIALGLIALKEGQLENP